jgi:hypothetical protein
VVKRAKLSKEAGNAGLVTQIDGEAPRALQSLHGRAHLRLAARANDDSGSLRAREFGNGEADSRRAPDYNHALSRERHASVSHAHFPIYLKYRWKNKRPLQLTCRVD